MKRFPGQAGFSLLEVLVAFSILSISLGVLLQAFSTTMRNAALSEEYSRATLLAQSRMDVMGVEEPIQEGETSGDAGDGYRWRVEVVAYQEQAAEVDAEGAEAEESEQPAEPAAKPRLTSRFNRRKAVATAVGEYQVTVEVSWGQGEARRQVVLTSLRLGAAER